MLPVLTPDFCHPTTPAKRRRVSLLRSAPATAFRSAIRRRAATSCGGQVPRRGGRRRPSARCTAWRGSGSGPRASRQARTPSAPASPAAGSRRTAARTCPPPTASRHQQHVTYPDGHPIGSWVDPRRSSYWVLGRPPTVILLGPGWTPDGHPIGSWVDPRRSSYWVLGGPPTVILLGPGWTPDGHPIGSWVDPRQSSYWVLGGPPTVILLGPGWTPDGHPIGSWVDPRQSSY